VDTVITPLFSYPLGPDAALIPRTPAIADAYHHLLVANNRRLARWEPWAATPPTPDGTRGFLETVGRGWLDGGQLPVAIAVAADGGGWRLVGSAALRLDAARVTAEVGYWIDGRFEGQGLVTRAVTALLDHGFGPLGLRRISLHTTADNVRSRAVARRLGFTEEGVLRDAVVFPDELRDEVVYGLLSDEWRVNQLSKKL
jgi:RimJ/RimL family protein N-acetyltransferase